MEKARQITLAQSNALTQARYGFTLYQKRFLYRIIAEVRRLYIESNEGNRTVYQNLLLTITPNQLKECGNKSKVFKEAVQLRQRSIYINRESEELEVGWINYVKRDKVTGMYEVEVSKEIMPELVELADRFTTYSLTVALTLKSAYSQRLYEMCSQYKNYQGGYYFRTVDALQSLLELPESYKDFGLFRRRVLEPAKREIKALYDANECDLWFEYCKKDMSGKKVVSLSFTVHLRGREDIAVPEDAIYFVRTAIAPLYRRDKKFIERIVAAIQLDPSRGAYIQSKLSEKLQTYPHKDLPSIVRYVLKEDFGIK